MLAIGVKYRGKALHQRLFLIAKAGSKQEMPPYPLLQYRENCFTVLSTKISILSASHLFVAGYLQIPIRRTNQPMNDWIKPVNCGCRKQQKFIPQIMAHYMNQFMTKNHLNGLIRIFLTRKQQQRPEQAAYLEEETADSS